MKIAILSDARSALASFRQTGDAAKGLGRDLDASGKAIETHSKRFGGLRAAGLAAGAGLGLLGGFVKGASDKFAAMAKTAGGLQRVMGGSIESASRWASIAKNSGLDTDVFSKSMGILSKHLIANDKPFQSMGISARDSTGKLKSMDTLLPQIADKFKSMPAGPEKTALALAIFGKAGLSMLPMLNKGSAGIEEMRKQSDKLGTTISTKQVDAFKKNMKAQREFTQVMDGIKVKIGAAVLPVLTLFARGLTKLSSIMEAHSKVTKVVAALLGAVAVALLGMMAVTKVVTVVKSFTAAMKLLNASFLTNPVFLVIAILAALAIGLYTLYQRSETFRNAVDAMGRVAVAAFGWMLDAGKAVFDWVSGHWELLTIILTGGIGAAAILIISNFSDIRDFIVGVYDWIVGHWQLLLAILTGPVGLFSLYVKDHLSAITGFFDDAITWVKSAFSDSLGWLLASGKNIIMGLVNGLSFAWHYIVEKTDDAKGVVTGVFASAFSWLGDAGLQIIRGLVNGLNYGWHFITEKIDDAKGVVVNVFASAFSWLGTAGGEIIKGLVNGLSYAWHLIGERVDDVRGVVTGALSGAFSYLGAAGGDIIRGLINGVSYMWGAMIAKVKAIPSTIANAIPNAIDWLYYIGRAVVTGLGQGIVSAITWLVSKIASLRDAIISALKSMLHIGSPSKDTMAIGGQITAGLGAGILAAVPALRRQLATVSDVVTSGLSSSPTVALGAIGGAAGATTIVVNVAVPVSADPASVGREIKKALDAYTTTFGRAVA